MKIKPEKDKVVKPVMLDIENHLRPNDAIIEEHEYDYSFGAVSGLSEEIVPAITEEIDHGISKGYSFPR
tara:strand:+ start:288 stop:494 length:207 start_codon:yes stop_codon:yes gene_type:complete